MLDCVSEAGFVKPLSSTTIREKQDILLTITTYHFFLKVQIKTQVNGNALYSHQLRLKQ